MSAKGKILYDNLVGIFSGTLRPVVAETMRLLPDSVVVGTAILSVISLCPSYGTLLLAMFELMFIQRVAASIIGGIMPVGAGAAALQTVCQPGFSFGNQMRISLLETLGKPSLFPSPVMFFLSSIVTYMIASLQEFSREIKTLGSDLEGRTLVATVLSGLFLFAMMAFRFSYGCETFGSIFLSAILGVFAGALVLYQNKALFGRASINLLNLPMIISSTDLNKPMFVCAST